jgi:hypothetical protein
VARSKRFENIQIFPNFDQSKCDLPELQKFEIKYHHEGFEAGNIFIHRKFFRFKMDFELKFGEFKVCFLFWKLIKIARNGLKSRNLHGGSKYNLEQFLCWKLLPNHYGF